MMHLLDVLLLSALAWGLAPVSGEKEARNVRLALCQIFSLDGDREGNFVRIENALKEAKAQGARIACFPETSILGWVNPAAHERAFPVPGKDTERLCELAKRYQIFVAIGLEEKDGDKLYDTAILVADDGRILLKHRKINILSQLMTPPYTPGESVSVCDTPFGRIGLLICADTFRQDLLQKMAGHRPDLVLVPYGWAADETEWPDHGKKLAETVSKAAQAVRAPVVGTDLVGEITNGPWKGKTYGGQSVACDAEGKVLVVARDRDRDVCIVELALGTSGRVRQ
jgi:predicted amidohydrolase